MRAKSDGWNRRPRPPRLRFLPDRKTQLAQIGAEHPVIPTGCHLAYERNLVDGQTTERYSKSGVLPQRS